MNEVWRYSSHSEQISAGVCGKLRLVLRCICSNVCDEKGVVSYWSKYSSDISIYCYPIITLQQLVVTLQYWTPFSAQTLEQRHLSTINNYWLTPIPVVSRVIGSCPCSCGGWEHAKWPISDLIRKQNIVSIYPRCFVIVENVISLSWWPFWKWCHIGSPSQFGDDGTHSWWHPLVMLV